MVDEVEVIHDGEGLAVFGLPNAVERFLDSMGLMPLSHELRIDRFGSILGTGTKVAEAAAHISENSGRYLKLTKESAEQVKELGLMPTKTRGISHAMLGQPGSIRKWIGIENGPTSLLTNPALLSGAAGIMAQLARQQEARELKQLLAAIDSKLDRQRRADRDAILAKMDRVSFVIDEAMTIREHGGDRETAWDKVVLESGIIAEVQANALREVEALADAADEETRVGELAKKFRNVESEVSIWFAVLARCFQLQNEYAVLELDRVLDAQPSALDGHRAGIEASRQDRRDKIIGKTQKLVTRLEEKAGFVQENVLLHAGSARSVVESINEVSASVEEFYRPLAIESQREVLTGLQRKDAIRDRQQWRNATAEAGPKVLLSVLSVGALAAGVLMNREPEDSSEGEPSALNDSPSDEAGEQYL